MTDAHDPALLADSLSGLTPEQRALLMLRLRQRSAQRSEGEPALVPVPRDRELPLSFAQQRLWFLDQWQPENPAWNIAGASRLTGRLDLAALRRAFDEIVRRHESLRTSFATVDGRPVQVVGPPEPLPAPLVDLSGLPEAVRDAEIGRVWEQERVRPFDLARDRLIRAALLRCAPGEHVSFVTMHHIVSDGWSLAVYIQEFAALYAAYREGRPDPLPELPVQYADFAVWQRDWLSGERLETSLDHWRRVLAGAPMAIELPVTRPWPAARTGRGFEERFALPAELAAGLRALSRREGATLFMTLLATLDTLLHRYSGAGDILVGSPVAGRNRAELEGLIGFFVNTLVLRANLAGDPSFRELLARTREVMLDAQAHQDVPFEKLVEELRPERDPLRPPLVQVVLSFQNTPAATLSLAEVELTSLDAPGRTALYDLLLSLSDVEDGLPGHLEVSADLFDASAARRIAGHFAALCAGIAKDPERRLSELPLLTEEECLHIVAESVPRPAFPSDLPLHRLFEAAAARNPAAVALSLEGRETTYRELDEQANRLARHLRRLGVGPEVRVGLCAGRSPELIAGLLGILKAGGAYVPLDPDLPAERLAFLREDSGVRVVVHEKDIKDLKDLNDLKDDEEAVSFSSFSSFTSFDSSPDHAAYVIYTSGSTGRPKGVVVRHREVARLFSATDAWFRFGPDDVWTLFHSYAFDFSVWEIWGALAHGGRLVIVPYAVSRSPEAFHALLARERVTVLNQTPSAFRQLVQWEREQPASAALALREVIFGGEALELPMLAPWFERHGDTHPRLVNMYGITETAVHVTFRPIRRSDLQTAAGSVIGKPIPDLSLWLRDGHGRPVADLVPGEIHVGGAGLARGYLGRPELTAERFVPDPFAEAPGERLYRTGDLARWRAQGELELLGRADRQVKVRGFRVEPAEIEAHLGSHPEVQEAVVAVRDGRLAAWVVSGNGAAPDLRAFLLERLPRHMVPALWSTLPALPRTPNGKIEYRALADPEAPAAGAAGYRAPRTPVEERLAAIWAEVLGLPRVGVHDNFFRLGGDSILSIRVVARARQAGLALTPRQIFERQTVAELAAVAQLLDSAEATEDAGPIAGEAPLTPIQRWFLDADPVDPHHYNQAVLLETRSPVEDGWLRRAIAGLLAHHDALRLRFGVPASHTDEHGLTRTNTDRRPDPGLVRARLCASVFVRVSEPPVTRVDLSALPEPLHRPALEAAAGQVQAGLDLVTGPLLRAVMFDLGAERTGRLLLVIHHLVVDGVSWRILLEDLQTFPYLPPKTTSWQRWARRLVTHARSAAVEAEADFWLSLPEPEPLPVDRSGGEDSEASAGVVSVALSPEATRALLRDAGAAWRTRPDDLLLAAVARAFAPWTGSPRLVLWLEGHGREEIFPDVDLSRTVGWFTSLAPVVLDLEGAADPGAAIRAVKESLRAAPFRGIGYGLLRWLGAPGIAGRLAARCEPEVVFNYLGQLDLVLPEGSRFAPAVEFPGAPRSPRARRRHRIEINAGVLGGRLEAHWSYGRNVHERPTIETLAERFLTELETLIEHCLSPGAGGWTPSDVPLARLDQETLDRLVENDPAIEDIYPLSPLQAGLLFHGLYAPSTEIYSEQITCTLRGDLDAAAFRRAWQRLLDRHGILRTAFVWEGLDEPLQVVRRGIEMPWTEEDWRGAVRDGADPDARLAAFAAADRRQAFDLRRAPLLRAALLRTGEREYRFVWSFHHLLLDGWSLPPLFAEVFALYADRPLPAPALPYRDFVAWLARRDRAADERYWRQALAGIDGPTPLPWDLSRDEAAPAERADDFTQHEILLAEPATAALDALARERGLTLNTVLQGAWALLLARWSGERDVVFGAVAAGRPAELPGFETALGLFINTLPVRLEADPERPLAAWLRAHQSAQVEARQHEQAPLAEVQRWSGAAGREPLFHSLLVFENYPLDAAVAERAGDIELSDVKAVERTSYPLSLAVVPGRRLRLRITHDRRLEPSTGDRLLNWLIRLLDAFSAGPELPLRDFELLSDAERAELLAAWDEPALDRPAEPVLRRFERWVAETPDAPAVRDAAEALTFAELDRRATQLAEHLRARGVGPGTCVPLDAERSARVLVGILGIWKAGAAWVPIDPAGPQERRAAILADCEAVDTDEHGPTRTNTDGAYVLYTSGSTGTPKGVVIDHHALANYLAWVDGALLAPVDHRLPATSGLTFDASLKQILGPLLAGREVRILPEETATGPVALANALAAEGFAAWNGVPALWSALLDAIESGDAPRPEALERVLLGGEALPPALVERTRRLLPRVELWNLYGPTEATANATAARLVPGDRVHLGTPLPGTRVRVLDRDGRLVPPGGSGELCLAGAGLARGYLGRPDLTAERFLPDLFSGIPGERLYRTGDLVRWSGDGLLEHRGRVDSQVKVRGFRIELGEIEAALRGHPAVRDAVVTVRQDPPGEIRLAAWISSADQIPAADLKAWLRERLPAAAVPADLVLLPDLPRLPNGKADRRALQARTTARIPEGSGAGRPFEAPADDVEEKLAGLWRDLLKVERVGRSDNFFDLGGHSLLATRLMVRIRDGFGVEIPLPAIFEAEDLAALAREVLALRLRAEDPDDLAHLMAELDGLSDDQVESLLAEAPDQEDLP